MIKSIPEEEHNNDLSAGTCGAFKYWSRMVAHQMSTSNSL